jgi:hypothetical protein
VLDDADGAESRRFGAAASGHVVAYDAAGRLRFHGGVTASRGHEGDNAGADALVAILRGGKPAITSAPTFGCAIVPSSPAQPCDLCTVEEGHP